MVSAMSKLSRPDQLALRRILGSGWFCSVWRKSPEVVSRCLPSVDA